MGIDTLEGLWVPYLRLCYQTHTHNRHDLNLTRWLYDTHAAESPPF